MAHIQNAGVGVHRDGVVPALGVGGLRGLQGGHFARGLALFAGAVEGVVIKGLFHEQVMPVVAGDGLVDGARSVGGGVIDGSGLVFALRRPAGHLHHGLDQVGQAVVVGVVVGFHVDAVAQDVAAFVRVVGVSGVAHFEHRQQGAVFHFERPVKGRGFFGRRRAAGQEQAERKHGWKNSFHHKLTPFTQDRRPAQNGDT